MIEQPTRFEPPRGRWISRPVAVVGFVLAAAAVLLLIALILLTDDPDGSTAGASPSATAPTVPASASASGSASAEASAAPSVLATAPPPRATPAPNGSRPLQVDGGTVAYQTQLAAAPGNGVYALMSAPDEVVLTQFNPDGTTRDGWPQRVASPYCIDLLVAADGSVRALCDVPLADDGLQEPAMRLFAWEANGTTIAGWPVEIAGARSAAIVGDRVAVEVRPYAGDAPPEGFIETVQLAYVDRDGDVQLGEGTVSFGDGDNQVFIGPNGTAYLFSRVMSPRKATHITAFGLDGPLGNWPLDVSGASSDPSFDAEGRMYIAKGYGQQAQTQMFVIDANAEARSDQQNLPITLTNPWSGAGDVFPWAPFIGGGTNFLASNAGTATAVGITPTGASLPGWPYYAVAGIQVRGACSGEDTGCGVYDVKPAASDDGVLYLVIEASSSSRGSSLIALASDGLVVSGWPVELTRAGAEFWDVVATTDGGVWALAVEPESVGTSATLLSIAPDSTVRGTVTIAEP